MSRSYRKTSITGITTAASDKQDKRLCNRATRRLSRMILRCDMDQETLPDRREVRNVYGFAKDGKKYFNAKEHPDLMEK